jgi:hypothetical protein
MSKNSITVLALILSQLKSVQTYKSYSLKNHLNIILPSMFYISQSGLFPSGFLTKAINALRCEKGSNNESKCGGQAHHLPQDLCDNIHQSHLRANVLVLTSEVVPFVLLLCKQEDDGDEGVHPLEVASHNLQPQPLLSSVTFLQALI